MPIFLVTHIASLHHSTLKSWPGSVFDNCMLQNAEERGETSMSSAMALIGFTAANVISAFSWYFLYSCHSNAWETRFVNTPVIGLLFGGF